MVGFDAAAAAVGPVEGWRHESGGVRVLAGAVRHEPVVPAVAYRVETPDGAVVSFTAMPHLEGIASYHADTVELSALRHHHSTSRRQR